MAPVVSCWLFWSFQQKIKIHSIIHFPLVLSPTIPFRSAFRSPYHHTGPGSFGSRFRVFRPRNSKTKANNFRRKSCFLEVGCSSAGEKRKVFRQKTSLLPDRPPCILASTLGSAGRGRVCALVEPAHPRPLTGAPLEVGLSRPLNLGRPMLLVSYAKKDRVRYVEHRPSHCQYDGAAGLSIRRLVGVLYPCEG